MSDLPPFDETVGEGPPERLPPGDAGRALVRQRVYHGLLRAMHTMDAESREARIRGIVDRLDEHGGKVHQWRPMALAAGALFSVALTTCTLPSSASKK